MNAFSIQPWSIQPLADAMGVDLSMDITQDRVIDKFNALLGEFKRDIALGFCLPVELDPVSGTCVNYKRAEEARIVVNTTIIDGRSVHLGVSSRYNLGCGKCTATVQIDTPIFLPGHSTPSIFVYLNGSTIASLVCQSDPANVFADSLLKARNKSISYMDSMVALPFAMKALEDYSGSIFDTELCWNMFHRMERKSPCFWMRKGE
jgi:hypothetical protein